MNRWIVAEKAFLRHNERMGVTRRDFLKLGGGLLLGDLVGKLIGHKELVFGLTDPDRIISEVPPQLESMDIPPVNEYWRRPDLILQESFDQYEKWRIDDPTLPEIIYHPPANFLDIPSLTTLLTQSISPRSLVDVNLLYGQIRDAIELNDEPYSNFSNASGGGFERVNQLIYNDPGCGLVSRIRSQFEARYGKGFELCDMARIGRLDEDQLEFIKEVVHIWDQDAKAYVSKIREGNSGKPISSNVMFSYFLYVNQGDVMHAVWDTSNWFELQARNDIPELTYSPNQEKARYLANNFIDEFTTTGNTINWLNEVVEDADPELWEAKTDKLMNFKDFLLINRVGGFYHWWNIIALSGCMSPPLVKRMIASYTRYLVPSPDGKGYLNADGREKMNADVEASKYADEIKSLLDKYTKK